MLGDEFTSPSNDESICTWGREDHSGDLDYSAPTPRGGSVLGDGEADGGVGADGARQPTFRTPNLHWLSGTIMVSTRRSQKHGQRDGSRDMLP